MYQNDPLKVLTGEVRFSYISVITPRPPMNGGEPKYEVTLLIPKSDVATKADIDSAIQAAMNAAVNKTWGGVAPPNIVSPLHDGDGPRQDGTPYGEECRGCWVITAHSKIKPQVVGIDNINTELAPNDIYSGMYGRATIRFYGYHVSGKKGIGCGLGNLLKTRDGEPLAGRSSAATDFADFGNAVVQPQAPAASVPGYPQPAPAYPQPSAAPAPTYQQPSAAPTAQPGATGPVTGWPY